MASKTLREVVELSKIVQPLVPKKFLEWAEKSDSREARIYRRISDSLVALSEKDIAASEKMKSREVQKSLSALKTRLLNVITELVLPDTQYSDYARRLFVLDVAHARMRILARLGAAFTANEEATYLFGEAKALEEWPVAISLFSPLLEWAMLSGDKDGFDLLVEEQKKLIALQSALRDAGNANRRATMVFAKSGAEHPELLEILRPAIERLEPIVRELGTFRLSESLLMLRRKAQQVTMDYDEAIASCEEMDALLAKYPLFANRARKSRNALAKLVCLVQRKKHEDARRVAESSLDLFDIGDQSWHTFQAWRFVLLMHTAQFSPAYELAQSVMGSAFFPLQTSATRDLWNLFLRYAEYFTGHTVTGANVHRNEKSGELHQRLMKEFPSFKGDYAGYELAAIVLEILIILRRNPGDISERMEAIRKYKARHIAPDTQSAIFIELLELLATYSTDWKKIPRIAAPLVERMVAIKTIDKVQSQQVLPYEMLWAEAERVIR